METIEYRNVVDKSEWLRGPWDDEPDKKQWKDETTGLPCLIVRGPSGALCGYVGVTEGHPFFQRNYSDLDLEAHGGLTFASSCMHERPGIGKERLVCHIPEDEESDNVWWLGFDCAHYMDLCPAHGADRWSSGGMEKYRDFAYVTQQVTNLARQIEEKVNV